MGNQNFYIDFMTQTDRRYWELEQFKFTHLSDYMAWVTNLAVI